MNMLDLYVNKIKLRSIHLITSLGTILSDLRVDHAFHPSKFLPKLSHGAFVPELPNLQPTKKLDVAGQADSKEDVARNFI